MMVLLLYHIIFIFEMFLVNHKQLKGSESIPERLDKD